MDILVLYLGRRGAGTAYTANLVRGLKYNGLTVGVVVSKQNETLDDFTRLGLDVIAVSTFKNILQCLIYTPFLIWSVILKLYLIVRQGKPKAVICTMHHVWGPVLAVFFRMIGVTYILVVHDAEVHPGDGGYFHQKLLEWHINSARKWVALTRHVVERLDEKGCPLKEVVVIPLGVLPYFLAKSPRSLIGKEEIIITFFGRILYYKGLDILLEAWPTVVSVIPNAILYICGHGELPESPVWKSHAGSIRLKNEWINDTEIALIFKETDLMVFPYREASQSGVLAIAFPAAIPVVATPLEGLKEQLQYGGGLLSKSAGTSDFAAAIIKVISDDGLYLELSGQCMEAARKLSWCEISKLFKKFVLT